MASDGKDTHKFLNYQILICTYQLHSTKRSNGRHKPYIKKHCKWVAFMEDGGVDTTVIESQQCKRGGMAEFPPLLALSVFDL